jgi:excisionase family DNA binding protein
MDTELLTIPQVLERLRISRTTLYRHVKARELPHVKLGKRVLFRKADVEKFITSNLVK